MRVGRIRVIIGDKKYDVAEGHLSSISRLFSRELINMEGKREMVLGGDLVGLKFDIYLGFNLFEIGKYNLSDFLEVLCISDIMESSEISQKIAKEICSRFTDDQIYAEVSLSAQKYKCSTSIVQIFASRFSSFGEMADFKGLPISFIVKIMNNPMCVLPDRMYLSNLCLNLILIHGKKSISLFKYILLDELNDEELLSLRECMKKQGLSAYEQNIPEVSSSTRVIKSSSFSKAFAKLPLLEEKRALLKKCKEIVPLLTKQKKENAEEMLKLMSDMDQKSKSISDFETKIQGYESTLLLEVQTIKNMEEIIKENENNILMIKSSKDSLQELFDLKKEIVNEKRKFIEDLRNGDLFRTQNELNEIDNIIKEMDQQKSEILKSIEETEAEIATSKDILENIKKSTLEDIKIHSSVFEVENEITKLSNLLKIQEKRVYALSTSIQSQIQDELDEY